jgi:hypothetical protein
MKPDQPCVSSALENFRVSATASLDAAIDAERLDLFL